MNNCSDDGARGDHSTLQAAEKELQQVLDRKASQNSLLIGEKHKIESEIPQVDAQRQALIEQLI